MKRCPTCNQTFTDRNLSFCIDDGTPLLPIEDAPDEVTVVSPAAGSGTSGSGGPSDAGSEETVPAYQRPGAYTPTNIQPTQRKVWPWILGLLLLLVFVMTGLVVAAWFYLRSIPKYDVVNTNTSNSNTNSNRADANLNANNANSPATNQNLNDNSDASDSTPAPTDESVVLGDLTGLEREWTVANIDADKKKLNKILADDYVGTSAEGRAQGKGDYLRTVQPDPRIQKWEFDQLKVALKGDRATLTGVLRLKIQDQDVVYRFVDKFVWRDGRWQATSSEVTELKEESTTL